MRDQRYSSKDWRRLRRLVLHAEPVCYEPGCGMPSVTVDHIVPALEAPELFLVRSNLRGSCVKHNMGRPFARLQRMAAINRMVGEVRDW